MLTKPKSPLKHARPHHRRTHQPKRGIHLREVVQFFETVIVVRRRLVLPAQYSTNHANEVRKRAGAKEHPDDDGDVLAHRRRHCE